MGGPTDTGTIDFPPDREHDDGREVDAETNVSAAALAFNGAALSGTLPDWLKDALLDRAEQIRDAAGDLIIDNRMRPNDMRLRQVKTNAEDDDNLSQLAQIVQQEWQQRERDWDRSRVEIGNMAMSGEDWDAAYEFLSDPKMRDSLIDRMTRTKGWTKDRAEKAADDALTLAQIAQRKKDGTSTATDHDKAEEITRRNPDAVEMVKQAAQEKLERGLSTEADASSPTQSVLSGDITSASSGYQDAMKNAASVANKRVGNDAAFASAPDLASHFDEARKVALATPVVEPAMPLPQKLVAKIDMNGPF